MSFVTVVPEFDGQAAGQLENIGSALSAANAAAASTTRVVAAAGDQVSAAIASLFSSHAQEYQALNAPAACHQQFLQTLTSGAEAYAGAEAASASHLEQLVAAMNLGAGANGPLAGPGATSAADVALIMGGSGEPMPTRAS